MYWVDQLEVELPYWGRRERRECVTSTTSLHHSLISFFKICLGFKCSAAHFLFYFFFLVFRKKAIFIRTTHNVLRFEGWFVLLMRANRKDFHLKRSIRKFSYQPTAATVTRQIIFDWNSFVNGANATTTKETNGYISYVVYGVYACIVWNTKRQCMEWAWKCIKQNKIITEKLLTEVNAHNFFCKMCITKRPSTTLTGNFGKRERERDDIVWTKCVAADSSSERIMKNVLVYLAIFSWIQWNFECTQEKQQARRLWNGLTTN